MGLGGIFGGINNAARKVLPGIDPKKKPLAPPPTDAATSLAAPAPPTPNAGALTPMVAAMLAAKRAKRKGATLGAGSGSPTSSIATGAGSAARGLIGY